MTLPTQHLCIIQGVYKDDISVLGPWRVTQRLTWSTLADLLISWSICGWQKCLWWGSAGVGFPSQLRAKSRSIRRSGRAKRGLKITGPGTRISVHGEGSHRGRLDSSQAARAFARKGEQSLLLVLKRPH